MEEQQKKDEFYMQRALDEAQAALEAGEIPIGAIIVCKDRILLLQMALFNDLHHIQTIEAERQPEVKPSRQEHVFNQFIDLVNKHGSRERRIQFYAERLLLSPNRLSTIIKDYSGHTIMEWLNEKTLLQAKVLLRHSDLMIYEIADRLGFPEPTAFNRYFKREVGVTPSEYRN